MFGSSFTVRRSRFSLSYSIGGNNVMTHRTGWRGNSPDARFDLLLIGNFFDARTCEKIVAEMRASTGGSAMVYGAGASGAVNERMRKVTRLVLSPETGEFVRRRLLERKDEVGERFGVSLSDCEEPQFLRYMKGDFFVAHQDGNTPLLLLDRERIRKVSVVIFLNAQTASPSIDGYRGGHLRFTDTRAGLRDEGFSLSGEAGALVAFRPETTHEVTPLTHGERYSIVCWYR